MTLLTLLVGPPGSGKSTLAHSLIHEDGDHGAATVYINQDLQGKDHLKKFEEAIREGHHILVDRMNFSKGQRARYLEVAKANGYTTHIRVLHQPRSVCLERCKARVDHPTIKDEADAERAVAFFFSHYERVEDSEADKVTRTWPSGTKPLAVICDLDGTLCNVDHRIHYVRREGKKDWKSFSEGISLDTPNAWCADLVNLLSTQYKLVYCSGRSEEYRDLTVQWFEKNDGITKGNALFMRPFNDSRKDSIVKEIILDFEILTRFTPYFAIDDRTQVVETWRKRGITTLQCAKGDF